MTEKPHSISELRLVGISGTNKVMAGELSRLTNRAFSDRRLPQPRKEGLGALVYPFDAETAALAVQYHRTSSRVLWSLFRSSAPRLEPLYDDLLQALEADGEKIHSLGRTFSVTPANLGNFAAGERQVVGVVKNALIDSAARSGITMSVDAENPDIPIRVSMHNDDVTVSVDLAGRPMNQRGYRTDTGTAPLRENLAAVLVMLSRYDARKEFLVDPMAGSGTIAIEGACMAQGKALWVPPRRPAADRLAVTAAFLENRKDPLFGDTEPLIIATELEKRIHRLARKNMKAAGVGEYIDSRCGDFRDLKKEELVAKASERGLDPERGVILSNPPYGERIAQDRLVQTYRDLGRWCRQFKGWRAAFLVANEKFAESFGGDPRIKKPLSNGPLRGYFLLYDL